MIKVVLFLILSLSLIGFSRADDLDAIIDQIRADQIAVSAEAEAIQARNQIAIDYGKELAERINAKQVVGQTVSYAQVYLDVYSKYREYEDKGQPNPDFVSLAMKTVKENILFALTSSNH